MSLRLPNLEQDDSLSPLSPTTTDGKSPATTRESWVPNRRVSDSATPNDDLNSSSAMQVPSPRVLDALRYSRSLLLPLVAIAYIVFCYTVHYKTIPVRSGGLFDDSPANLAVIKSGVTSISIIIIGLGLLPIHSLIADLKSEEFFRITRTRRSGAPLGYINGISSPSFGIIDSIIVVVHRYCSPYFVVVVVATILALVTSTLAPAALSVDTALFDSDIQAFAVGAIKRDDLLNASDITPYVISNLSLSLGERASTLAWVENTLEVPYSFQVDNPKKYIVPAPVNLPVNVPARWLSDVIVMNPVCTWGTPHLNASFTDSYNLSHTIVDIENADLTVSLLGDSMLIPDQSITLGNSYISNTTDTGYPTSGAMIWLIAQCYSTNCNITSGFKFDLSESPTLTLHRDNAEYQVAFLICSPNATVETHEIRSDGHGRLTVLDTAYIPRQGNLHLAQVAIMLTYALGRLDTNAGPQSASADLGSESQATLLFGPGAANWTGSYLNPPSIRLQPLSNISDTYARMLQSASKVFLDGTISTAYVPGRLSIEQLIFASSLPQVIVSTILFVVLCTIVAVAHFRKNTPKFTLFSVAAALDGSEIPATFAQVNSDADCKAREIEMVAPMGWKMVTLKKSEIHRDVLHLN